MAGDSDETPLSRLRRATERGQKLLGGKYKAEEALMWWQPTQVAYRSIFGGDSELVKQMIAFRPKLLQRTATVAEINEYYSRALHVLASLESLSGAHPAHAAPRTIPSTKNVFVIHGHDELNTRLLEPVVRDIRRLTESRVVPPVLFEAMGSLPPSGDYVLDALLRDATSKFKDPAPKSRAEATEKLWDAWERLKSLEIEGNKRMSIAKLLDKAAPEPMFRALLEAEARALTAAGNSFHIRHFETDKVPLSQPEHWDYLFHRLFALMHLLLFSRSRGESDA